MDSPGTSPTAADRKRELRASARARRAAADPAERERLAADWTRGVMAIADAENSGVVAVYESYGTEPPTGHLVAELRSGFHRTLTPVLLPDLDLDWIAVDEAAPPMGRDAILTADVVVVPALLVGLDGARLGQGGGSYDRALRRIDPGTPVVALVHDDELVAAGVVPAEAHDVGVTHVVTPTRTVVIADRTDSTAPALPIDSELDTARSTELDVALAVAAGGALGSAARWGLGEAIPRGGGDFPWATFLENVVGAFLLGVLAVALIRIWTDSRYARPFLAVGVLGGFTTFSTYVAELRDLTDGGHAGTALLYLLLTLLVGLAASVAGLAAGRAVLGRRP